MKPRIYKLELLTPLFSRGCYDTPEIRPPSIRGQLHHWLRQLGYDAAIERRIFGAVQHGFGDAAGTTSSKVVIRVANVQGRPGTSNTLPHKNRGEASPKNAYPPKSTFELHVLERLGGLDQAARIAFDRCLESWLLAGALGLRATRGAGAFQWDLAPQDFEVYRRRLSEVFENAPLRSDVLNQAFTDAEEARKIATDTISHQAFKDLSFPLGAVRQGQRDLSGAPQRKTSPLRLTVRRFNDKYRLVALWDMREEVTGNTLDHLKGAVKLLSDGGGRSGSKRLGPLLANSTLVE